MDEKLQELLNAVQKTAADVSNTAGNAAYCAGKKATQLLSVGKMNIQVLDLKSEVNLLLREIGELVYKTHTGDPTDSDVLLAKLQEIDERNAAIAALNTEIAALRSGPVCPVCGTPAQKGDVFCRGCGSRL